MLSIKEQDVVEVLPGCPWSSLVYRQGIVGSVSGARFGIINFTTDTFFTEPTSGDKFCAKTWCIPIKYLKVVDSPCDNRVGELEEEILGLESDLVMVRSCLSMSEEVRERQENQINKLIEDIDILRAELYRVRGY